MEAEQAQTTPNEHEQKSNEYDQAAGTSTEHKQPQVSMSECQMAKRERMNVNKGGRVRMKAGSNGSSSSNYSTGSSSSAMVAGQLWSSSNSTRVREGAHK